MPIRWGHRPGRRREPHQPGAAQPEHLESPEDSFTSPTHKEATMARHSNTEDQLVGTAKDVMNQNLDRGEKRRGYGDRQHERGGS